MSYRQFMNFVDPSLNGLWAPLFLFTFLPWAELCRSQAKYQRLSSSKLDCEETNGFWMNYYTDKSIIKALATVWTIKTVIVWPLKDKKDIRSWKYAELSCLSCLPVKSPATTSRTAGTSSKLRVCSRHNMSIRDLHIRVGKLKFQYNFKLFYRLASQILPSSTKSLTLKTKLAKRKSQLAFLNFFFVWKIEK